MYDILSEPVLSIKLVNWNYIQVQGDFFLNWSPPKVFKYKSLYNLWHLEKFWPSFDGILYLENIGGYSKKVTLYIDIS